jgi:LPXTG-motif cell wall-anchored protein
MWHRRPYDRQLEAALRQQRVEPPARYVSELTERMELRPRRRTHLGSRLAFAGAISTLILGLFASFGGLGYAASGATSTYHVVKSVVVHHNLKVTVHQSSAQSQYPPPPHPPHPPRHHGAANTAAGNFTQSAGVAQQVASGALPLTGFSLVATVALGLALLATGLVLRRREKRG